MTVHLTFGGSTAHRWLRCPGSVQLIATLPPQPENEYMAEGTRAHALLEGAVRSRSTDVMAFVGERGEPHWPPYTEDDCTAVQVALDYVNEMLDRHPDAIFWTERHVVLPQIADVGGTADILIYIPSLKHLHVIDYKHGRGSYVVADGNPQLQLYAACALFSMPELAVSAVYATIVQPRCQIGEPIRTAVYGPAELITFVDDVEAAVAAARTAEPPLVPGPEQCKWCPAAHICPAVRNAGIAPVDTGLAVPPGTGYTPPMGDDVLVRLPAPGTCRDPQALALTLEAGLVLRNWLDAIEDQAFNLAKGGQTIPGFKLVEKRATRKWADEDHAEYAAKELGLPSDTYAPRKLLSVAQMEKALKPKGKDALAYIAKFVTKESSGLKLVPSSAPGEPVNPLHLEATGFQNVVLIQEH